MANRADDVSEIIMLTHRYARAVDSNTPGDLRDVFTEDAVLDFSAVGLSRFVGLTEILEYFANSRASGRQAMHVVTNHVIDSITEDSAEGTHYTQSFRADPDGGQPLTAALVLIEDRYRRSGSGWQISHRSAASAIDIAFDF